VTSRAHSDPNRVRLDQRVMLLCVDREGSLREQLCVCGEIQQLQSVAAAAHTDALEICACCWRSVRAAGDLCVLLEINACCCRAGSTARFCYMFLEFTPRLLKLTPFYALEHINAVTPSVTSDARMKDPKLRECQKQRHLVINNKHSSPKPVEDHTLHKCDVHK